MVFVWACDSERDEGASISSLQLPDTVYPSVPVIHRVPIENGHQATHMEVAMGDSVTHTLEMLAGQSYLDVSHVFSPDRMGEEVTMSFRMMSDDQALHERSVKVRVAEISDMQLVSHTVSGTLRGYFVNQFAFGATVRFAQNPSYRNYGDTYDFSCQFQSEFSYREYRTITWYQYNSINAFRTVFIRIPKSSGLWTSNQDLLHFLYMAYPLVRDARQESSVRWDRSSDFDVLILTLDGRMGIMRIGNDLSTLKTVTYRGVARR